MWLARYSQAAWSKCSKKNIMKSTRSPKNRKQMTDMEQAKAFRKAAREIGADASDEQFKNALRAVAKQKPADEPRPKAPRRSK
jgi:hypothetical protein